MSPSDFRVLFLALSFMAVVTDDGNPPRDAAPRAKRLAKLLEEFCREVMPEAFEPAEEKFAAAERMKNAILEIAKTRDGICDVEDLLAKGFTKEEIKRHGPMASALAHVAVNLKKLPDA